MNVLRHDDIPVNTKDIVFADSLQRLDKRVTSDRIREFRLPVITTKSQEVNLSRLVKALQSPWHERMLLTPASIVCDE